MRIAATFLVRTCEFENKILTRIKCFSIALLHFVGHVVFFCGHIIFIFLGEVVFIFGLGHLHFLGKVVFIFGDVVFIFR